MKTLWHTFQRLFAQVVERIETNPASLGKHIALFIAILAVRMCLEFFSNNRLYTLWDVLNTGLWFIFIVLAFLVQLWAGSKVPIGRVARLVVSGFGIALTAPIIDLLISGTLGANRMSYLMGQGWAEIAYSYITIGGSSLSRGATIGIRIEIVLLVLATFQYVRLKTGSAKRALFWAWMIYTVLFASGWVPKFVGALSHALQLTFSTEDQSGVLALLCADLLLFGVVMHAHRWPTLKKAWGALPWPLIIPHAALLALGAVHALRHYPGNWALSPTTMFHPILALVALGCLLLGLGLARLPQQHQAAGQALRPWVTAGMAVSAGAISPTWLFALMVAWGLLFIHHDAPLRLGRLPGTRHLLTGMGATASILLGHVLPAAPMIGAPGAWILATLAMGTTAALLLDTSTHPTQTLRWYPHWAPATQRTFRTAAALLWLAAATAAGYATAGWTGIAILGPAAIPAAITTLLPAPKITPWAIALPAIAAAAHLGFGG